MKAEGKNAVAEAIKSRNVKGEVILEKGKNAQLAALAQEYGVKVRFADKSVLDAMSVTGRHQGAVAELKPFEYGDLTDLLTEKQDLFLVILDEISDPHNLGSIIRVCECAGVDGIILGKNRQVPVNETVIRCSAGAIAHVKIACVTNVNMAIKQLKEAGVWVYCADMDGQVIYDADLSGRLALVVGGEGYGVSRLTKSLCDGVLAIPLQGKVNSLNASVACGIAVYEAVRQRGKFCKKN